MNGDQEGWMVEWGTESITGTLKVRKLNGIAGTREEKDLFRVLDDQTGLWVGCWFQEADEEEARELDGHDVRLNGLLIRDHKGDPMLFEVETLEAQE